MISTSAPAAEVIPGPLTVVISLFEISKLNDVPPTAFFPFKSIPLQFTLMMEFVTLPAEVQSPIPKSPDWISALSISMNEFSAQIVCLPLSLLPQPLFVPVNEMSDKENGLTDEPEE